MTLRTPISLVRSLTAIIMMFDTPIAPFELAQANAEVVRRIWAHAGLADRITCVVGTIGDGGATLDLLA